MFSQLFLDFLRGQGVISEQQAHDVFERKKTVKIPVGTLALSEGLMTAKQLEAVVRLQSSMDMRFGEIALMKGYLTAQQLTELLAMQPKEHMYLSQVLTDWGILDFDAVIEQTMAFQEAYSLGDGQMERLIDNDVEEFVVSIARVGEEYPLFRTFATQFLKVVTRLVDRDVLIRPAYHARELKYKYLAYQPCDGMSALYCCFEPDSKGICAFAQCYAGEEITEVGDLARDAIMEFLNCVNGMFVTRLADENIAQYEIKPPAFKEDGVLSSQKPFCLLPFRLPFGEFTVFALEQDSTRI